MATPTRTVTTLLSPEVAEVIARLDEFERALAGMVLKVREMRLDLFESGETVNLIEQSPCEHGRRFCLDCHKDSVLD